MYRQRPRLKNGVDLQLQSAFQEGNWTVVVRLAEKRAKTFNDQYYDIVKICAESQLDDPNAKFSAISAIWQYVNDGTVVKDADGLDLLEWATLNIGTESDFVHSLGPLRVRCAKNSPKDKFSTTRCLESCLLHWDLVSAQQIAAIIDKSFPQERSFMFWNIVITYMLSQSPQSPTGKQKLYATLSQKQIERAAQLTEQAESTGTEGPNLPARGVQTEEEVRLLYDIIERIGNAEDFKKLVDSPVFSPLTQFRRGRKEVFRRVIRKYRQDGSWRNMFNLCQDCLLDSDESSRLTLEAADWSVWQAFIEAASHLKSVDPTIRELVQKVLLTLVKVSNSRPIYRRNILLARVAAAFELLPDEDKDIVDGKPSSSRFKELINFVNDQFTSAFCFDDIKNFVEKLDVEAQKYLSNEVKAQAADDVAEAQLQLLSFKLQYLFLTSDCRSSEIELLSVNVIRLHASLLSSTSGATQSEITTDLAILFALCKIQVAFSNVKTNYMTLPASSIRLLLQSLFVLEQQLTLTPKHSKVSVMLISIHILLGSAARASEIWETLDVKNTIVDSLAPIFFDRLSTVAPSVISPSENWGFDLMDKLRSHYDISLKMRMPKRLIDAFEAGSYGSIIDIPQYVEKLRASCTRVMSLVEGVRAERFLEQPYGELLHDSRFADVVDDLDLTEIIDYGSFPSWECRTASPIYEKIRIGPPPTNRRSHLSLLSEAFHDVLFYKPPTVYKVSTNATGTDQMFVLETMSQLSNSFAKFMNGPKSIFTASEAVYFETLSLLSALIPFCAGLGRSNPVSGAFELMVDAVLAGLDTIRGVSLKSTSPGIVHTAEVLSSMHHLAMLRDTAVATRLATQWLLSFNEREKERDRSGQSNLPKEMVLKLKELQAASDSCLKNGKDRVTKLKGVMVPGVDFAGQIRSWVFDDEGEAGAFVADGRVSELVKSWRSTISGWQQVKWE